MSKATQLADATDGVAARLADCNAIVRKLLAELPPFQARRVEVLLDADCDRIMALAMDLVDARARLAEAHADYQALVRRAER